MRAALELAAALLRGAGRRAALSSALAAAAVAIATALLLLTLAANQGFAARAEREAWRSPVPADADAATAVMAVSRDAVRGEPLTLVDLAALSPQAPAPPGLDAVPAPGEVWLSPALAELAARLPAEQLAERFDGRVVGEIGAAGLVHPEELVAVVGRAPDDPVLAAEVGTVGEADDFTAAPTPIARYATAAEADTWRASIYETLSAIASVLVVVPLLVLGAAGGRLLTAQRDRRLAALRLVGATPRQVLGVTLAETLLVALVGTACGIVVSVAALPAAARLELGGGPWYLADLWLGPLLLGGALVVVPLLVGGAALAGMRRLVISPLGVARRETPPRLRAVRVLVFAAVLVVYVRVASDSEAATAATAGVVAAVVGAIALVGPWVVMVFGRLLARAARRPATLLAARRLVDDPRGAWRTVGGIVLAGFVAGFVVFLAPVGAAIGGDQAATLLLPVPAAAGDDVAATAAARLDAAGVSADVQHGAATMAADGSPAPPPPPDGEVLLRIAVDGDAAALDTARTALAGLLPGRTAVTQADLQWTVLTALRDIVTGATAVLAATMGIAVSSAAITGAATVLDRRATFAALRLAGTPLRVLDAARTRETLLPLLLLGGGAVATGLACGVPLAMAAGLTPSTEALPLLVCLAVGLLGAVGASRATRPLLRRATADLAVARE